MNHFLISLQEAACANIPLSGDTPSRSWPGLSDIQDSTGAGSVSLLQFVRADVDEWIQAESVHLQIPDDTAESRNESSDSDGTRWDNEESVLPMSQQEISTSDGNDAA